MDNKISFWKSQWFDILAGLVGIGLSIYYMIVGNDYLALGWLISGCVWTVMAHVEYNDERIKLLEVKAKKADALDEKVRALEELMRTQDKLTNQRLEKLEGKNESSRTLHS